MITIAVVACIIVGVICFAVGILYRKRIAEAQIGSAEEKARKVIDDAIKTGEAKKREMLLEAKEENIKVKSELDKEVKERRGELQQLERRLMQKEESLDKKVNVLEQKEDQLQNKLDKVEKTKLQIQDIEKKQMDELERISALTSEEAKQFLLKTIEDEVKHESAILIKDIEAKTKLEADKKAKEILTNAIQKCAADHVVDTTVSVVPLPNDEMKGRIIGREGRNIRTLETLTGIDLIIDDTPEAVILSGFDPIRREIARIALEKLIVDGRIHPARIE
ncbi:MAG: Rnase Y domain-containing protein, partial [Cellulosilyticaceae bacterium]